jgi:hypothetical protein
MISQGGYITGALEHRVQTESDGAKWAPQRIAGAYGSTELFAASRDTR